MEIYAISRRGGYLEYKVQYLSKIPIKNISQVAQQPFIEKADEINAEWMQGKKSIGITGATSTPKWVMEEVKEYILEKKFNLKTAN